MIPGFDASWAGERCCRTPPIGEPGISRGSRKFSVSATQIAKT
jgi:hypothetical protein